MHFANQWYHLSRKWAPRIVRGFIREMKTPMAPPAYRPAPLYWNPNTITASWLGHASVLINFYGLNLITDPVLSRRIGISVGRATLGYKRLIDSPLRVRELPPIELILISHAHLDHLHTGTLQRFPATTRVVTAKNTRDLFSGTRMKEIHELAWGERTTLTTHHGEISIEAFEVHHWGARWKSDTHRGYNGYILERNNKKILFGGDTGLCESFKKLKEKGPFELAVMPIGSYKPGETSHCTPEEAISMANDAGAKCILPIHHQTFNLGKESPLEPIQRFRQALTPERAVCCDIGQTWVAPWD